MFWTQLLRPIQSLARFTKLRKIVAAQEAFFSVDESFSFCELFAFIEEIGMVDTTYAIDRWVGFMLENKWKYPKLKTITFWGMSTSRGILYQGVLKRDPRLGEESDFPWDDYDMYGSVEDELGDVKTNYTDEDGDEEMGGIEDEANNRDGNDDADVVDDDEDEEDMESDRGCPPPEEWKLSFVEATRGSSAVSWSYDVGVDVRREYCYDYSCPGWA
jgi:hypothetical protein